jgi:hypothetical protein
MRVRARSAAVVAGLVAAAYLVAVFTIRRVPDRVVAWLGGPTGLARDGGLSVRYRPPVAFDTTRFEQHLEARGATVRHEAGGFVLELIGIDRSTASGIISILTEGGLEFREAFEDVSLMDRAVRNADGDDVVAGVRVELEAWRPEGTTKRHSSSFLVADSIPEIDAAFHQLWDEGWRPPPHSIIAYERIEPTHGDNVHRVQWRSYFVGDRALLDGNSIASAAPSQEPNTGRPVVLLDFDRDGGERFGEITARIVGHKLATMVGGLVKSAPVIQTAIRGGRASITMGGGDLERMRREAAALPEVLRIGALPPGGVIDGQIWVAPAAIDDTLLLARLAIGLLGGALIGLAFGLVVYLARPSWQPRPPWPRGPLPLRRIAVTLLAPIAVLGLGQLALPGIDEAELSHIFAGTGLARNVDDTPIALGLGPILTAFVVVEVATLIIPRWRRVRLRPDARIAFGRWVALLGVAFALFQGHVVYVTFSHIVVLGDEVRALTWQNHLAVMATLATGTMLLVIVAGMIRQHGLGNGYAAVILSDWGLKLLRRISVEPTAGDALGLVTLVAIGVATVAVLRMRIGDDREVPLRVPSSGIVPLAVARSVLGLWWLATLGLTVIARAGLGSASQSLWLALGSILLLTPLCSLAFSRPAIVASAAVRGSLAPPSHASWWRATLLSFAMLAAIAAANQLTLATAPDAQPWCDPIIATMFAALVLDLLDDLRSRRGDLVVAWPLHQAHHAELVRSVLATSGIACHLSSSHLRTLLAFFGPYAPIDVLVPSASVDEARRKIAVLFDPAAVEAFD